MDAISAQPASNTTEDYDPPPFLTSALPALFPTSTEPLNPVAPGAQRKVPPPPTLNLADPINPNLIPLLASANFDPALQSSDATDSDAAFEKFYYQKPVSSSSTHLRPASHAIDAAAAQSAPVAYQSSTVTEEEYLDADIIARRKRERAQRNRDDPFYIFAPGDDDTPSIEAEIDNIPIMELKLDDEELAAVQAQVDANEAEKQRRRREKVEIAGDEMLEGADVGDTVGMVEKRGGKKKKGKGLLQMEDRGLAGFSLEGGESEGENERRRARREVERLRREMEVQVRKEREAAEAKKMEDEKKAGKAKKKKKAKEVEGEDGGEGVGVTKKKKKKVKKTEGEVQEEVEGEEGKKKKKVKKTRGEVQEGVEGDEGKKKVKKAKKKEEGREGDTTTTARPAEMAEI